MAKKAQVSDLLRHESGNMFFRITFAMSGGGEGELIAQRGLAFKTGYIVSELMNKGAKLSRKEALEEVKEAIDNAPTKPTGRLITRHGWNGDIFVTRNGVYGNCNGTVVYRPHIEDDPAIGASSGSLEAWREGLREALAGSSYLTFVTSLSFGATLAERIGVEGGVFCLVGETSTGKSLVARGGQSVMGRAQPNDLVSLALTPRAREELCESRSNGLVVVDETARLDAAFSKKDAEEFIYCIASGRGKIRSAIVSQSGPLANKTWHVSALLTSEVSFYPRTLKGGAGLRYAEIPVSASRFGGVFDRTGLKGKDRLERASLLAAQVEICIGSNFGVALAPFMSLIANNSQMYIERGGTLVEEFVVSVGAKGDAQKERLARKFAVAYAGGVIAAELDILPCNRRHISRSVTRLYKKAERLLGGAEGQSPSILKQISNGIDSGHFPILKKGGKVEIGGKRIWGIRRTIEEEAVVVLKLTELSRLAGSRGAARDLLAYWARREYLLGSADGKNTRQVEVKGWSDKRQRLVCLKRSALPTLNKAKGPVGK